MAFTNDKFLLVSSTLVALTLMVNVKPSLTQSTGDLINLICRNTEDFGYCNTTFYTHLKSPNANIADLTQITVEVASTQATQNLDYIRQIMDKGTKDRGLIAILQTCQEVYVQLTQSYGTAAVLFFQPDYQTLEKVEMPTPKIEAGCEAADSQHVMGDRSKAMRISIVMAVEAVELLLRQKSGGGLGQDGGAPSPL